MILAPAGNLYYQSNIKESFNLDWIESETWRMIDTELAPFEPRHLPRHRRHGFN